VTYLSVRSRQRTAKKSALNAVQAASIDTTYSEPVSTVCSAARHVKDELAICSGAVDSDYLVR
jgi:hypothetical protein